MITANIIQRTFRIKCGQSVGTGFAIDVDNKQYLVTAKHVIKGFSLNCGVEVFRNGNWVDVAASLVGHGATGIDVSVLAPAVPISSPLLPLIASSNEFTYGQDAYFLGFPYGVLNNVVIGNDAHPLPLVKKALLSGFAGNVYLLDGHNNPGFSGGPVVFGAHGKFPDRVAAVISGYKYDPEPIHIGDAETELTYRHNTGIIISYKIETATHLIHANPIGATM
jgi:S1-C subfamily serine protease